LPQDDAQMTEEEAMDYIKNRYPEQPMIWNDYMQRREIMKVKPK